MDRLKTNLVVTLALLTVLALSGAALAGSTGKIVGNVTDENGEPLPGASVVLQGTRLGASTDAEGFYVIISVDPAVYQMTASMVGYHSVTQEQIQVRSDFTTTLDFRLREQELELEEMVVVAEAPPVEPDKTESRYVLTAQDIARTPILRDASEFVALEAGVAVDGSGVIRGGQVEDNLIYVDGVRLQNQDGRGGPTSRGSQWWGANVKALQEVSVITGGMNAEYGNAQAGVVQMVTRDGGSTYLGEAEYRLTPGGKKHWGANIYDAPEHRGHMRWNDPAWTSEVDPETGALVHQRTNYTDHRGHYFDAYLGGPLLPETSFFISSRHRRDAAAFPGAWTVRPFNTRNTAKLTIRAHDSVKMQIGWIYDRWKVFNNGGLGGTTRSVSNVLRGPGRDIFLPEGSPAGEMTNTESVVYGVVTHTVSPRTFYELRLSQYQSTQDTSGVSNTTADIGSDSDGWFYTDRGDVRAYTLGQQTRSGLRFDLSSQLTKTHFYKIGIDFTGYSNHFIREGNTPGDARKQILYIGDPEPGTPTEPRQFAAYIQDKMEFEGFIVNAGIRYDRFWGANVPVMGALRAFQYTTMSRYLTAPRYPMKPIVNWSPRLGISHPITYRSSLHFFYGHFYQLPSFYQMFHDQWFGSGDGIPGIGFSEYTSHYRPATTSIARPMWDNTARTISFELGADWNFISDYTLALATFYKSASFQETGGWDVFLYPELRGAGVRLRQRLTSSLSNIRLEDTRGLEFSLRKGFSHYFSFRAALNLAWSDYSLGGGGTVSNGATVIPDSNYIASGNYFFAWEAAGGSERPVTLTDEQIRIIGHGANEAIRTAQADRRVAGGYVYDFSTNRDAIVPTWEENWLSDAAREGARGLWIVHGHRANPGTEVGRRSQGSLQMFLSTPQDFGMGPKVAGSTLLGGINANLIYRIYTGSQFTYLVLDGTRQVARGPLRTVMDLNLQKRFELGRASADVFLEVFNLFNQKDAFASGTDYMWWGLQAPRPNDANYLNYGDFQDRSRYIGEPRTTHVGIRMRF